MVSEPYLIISSLWFDLNPTKSTFTSLWFDLNPTESTCQLLLVFLSSWLTMAIEDQLNHTTEHHTHAPAPTPTLGVNQAPGIDYNHPLFLSPSDISGIQIISFQLTGALHWEGESDW
nr:uncharacterized protein LOC117281904 [Nicotiana tomentosiformis]